MRGGEGRQQLRGRGQVQEQRLATSMMVWRGHVYIIITLLPDWIFHSLKTFLSTHPATDARRPSTERMPCIDH